MLFMFRSTFLKRACLTALIPVCLAGCLDDNKDLTGYWGIDEKGCLTLCTFIIHTDKETGKQILTFDDDNTEIAEFAHGEFVHSTGKEYHLVFESGGKIEFILDDDKLVAEEGSVFRRLTRKI